MANIKKRKNSVVVFNDLENPGESLSGPVQSAEKDDMNALELDLFGEDPSDFLSRRKGWVDPDDGPEPVLLDAYEFLDELSSYEGSEDYLFDEFLFDDEY